jgi:hypothetical protein
MMIRVQNLALQLITKREQDTRNDQIKVQFSALRDSIQSLSTKNLSILKQELEELRAQVVSIESIMKERTKKVHGNTILDMNLERGRFFY